MKTGPVAKSTEKRFKYDSFLSSGKSWYHNESPSHDGADNLCQYLWGPYVQLKNFQTGLEMLEKQEEALAPALMSRLYVTM